MMLNANYFCKNQPFNVCSYENCVSRNLEDILSNSLESQSKRPCDLFSVLSVPDHNDKIMMMMKLSLWAMCTSC